MALIDVTPVVLTFNEEENIGRTLGSLREFRRVVVVDSGSTDRTEELARSFPNVSFYSRAWTGFREQWRFALGETGIATAFVLALDADMQVTEELRAEVSSAVEREEVDGATLAFEYRIRGIPLAGSLYPRQLRLLRLRSAQTGERGHAHELRVKGRVVDLSARLVHDDRKPLEMFVRAQLGYSAREAPRVLAGDAAGFAAWVRRAVPFAPFVVGTLAWLRAGGPFRGAAARRYALERLIYESLLRWRVEDVLVQRRTESSRKRQEEAAVEGTREG